MSDNKDIKANLDLLFKACEKDGVTITSLPNGQFFLLFKKAHMQKILDDHPDKDTLSILVVQPTLN